MTAWMLSALFWVAAVYAALCAVFYMGQDFFFFRPERLPTWFMYKYPFPFREIDFDMEDGGTVNALLFEVPNSKGVVYYIKGNSRSIKGWGKFAKDFVGKGYDFFILDYRGFGKSRGKRSESILYNDLQHAYRWLEKEYPESALVLYGRSLGSGLAARIASWNHPRMLLLDSPYYSFYHLVRRYGFWLPLKRVLHYPIRTDHFIQKVECPVHLLHGTSDVLIPFQHSKKLEALNPANIHLHPIAGAGHNNLTEFAEYHEVLYRLLE